MYITAHGFHPHLGRQVFLLFPLYSWRNRGLDRVNHCLDSCSWQWRTGPLQRSTVPLWNQPSLTILRWEFCLKAPSAFSSLAFQLRWLWELSCAFRMWQQLWLLPTRLQQHTYPLLPSCDRRKCLWTLPSVPWGDKITANWEPLSYGNHVKLQTRMYSVWRRREVDHLKLGLF